MFQPVDIIDGKSPAVFVATRTGILSQNVISFFLLTPKEVFFGLKPDQSMSTVLSQHETENHSKPKQA